MVPINEISEVRTNTSWLCSLLCLNVAIQLRFFKFIFGVFYFWLASRSFYDKIFGEIWQFILIDVCCVIATITPENVILRRGCANARTIPQERTVRNVSPVFMDMQLKDEKMIVSHVHVYLEASVFIWLGKFIVLTVQKAMKEIDVNDAKMDTLEIQKD